MPHSNPLALIDIGSNSVRLVIYDGLKRAPMPLFNEKVLCGLAKNIDSTGKLHKKGVEKALRSIKRFVSLAKIMDVNNLKLFATAAVRDAKDGKDFVQRINDELGVQIEIFSEEDEAKYAGMGIMSSITRPKGVVGDLGGGSLELVSVKNNNLEKGVSYPIGPLRLLNISNKHSKVDGYIAQYIKQFPLNESLAGSNFYAVGGSFRNLAKVHMGRKNYPLKVIHNYKVETEDIMTTIMILSRMSEESLLKIPGISKKRMKLMPYAAMVLKHIIKIGKPKTIVFSASGVREGFLYSQLDDETKLQDPLLCGASEMMARMLRGSEYGYELAQWMQPLFSINNSVDDKRLRLAACIMSDISAYENTEYRAEMAYRKILDSSLTGLNHTERLFIAKSLYFRYDSYPDINILSTMGQLLSSKKIQHAQTIGAAMQLARTISGSKYGVLEKAKLRMSKNVLSLSINKDIENIYGESVQRKVKLLADVVGKEARVL
ncbi:MAG: Ppx/GppA family phosphatase [Rickettsiales bacterium]|nr:Ppx/GppA family phosphatase [Pseudomonadota bacterium]MDA0966441.1 Ppx/GppA family phosphatase [Pseudomonadota bacterium]MDG4543303.1 Ppx/GppA family phosphatase [Rickettsiales bacterium]MDG4545569.1 Ppx/GppA family phosphatase [Rickettsiales bacterium]MDG4548018.1 Ppx/GppA family phosphatase [Rickettsiales bacterium]